MKSYVLLLALPILAACGTLGIGANSTTNIRNDSDAPITVTGQRGMQRIAAGENADITSKTPIRIQSSNAKCDSPNVVSEINTPALILNIVPGLVLGVIPLFVDAITGNLSRMPQSFTFVCN